MYPFTITHSLLLFAGTYQCRAGWSTSDKPELIFKNVTAKQRGRKEKVQIDMLWICFILSIIINRTTDKAELIDNFF